MIISKETESYSNPYSKSNRPPDMTYYFMCDTSRVSHLLFVGLASFHPFSLSEIDLFPEKSAH